MELFLAARLHRTHDQDGLLCCVRRVHHQTGSFLNSPPFPSALMAPLAAALRPAMTLSYFETSLSRLAPLLRLSAPPLLETTQRDDMSEAHPGWVARLQERRG